jgi:hypothetical protein
MSIIESVDVDLPMSGRGGCAGEYGGPLPLGSRVRPTVQVRFENLVFCLELVLCLGEQSFGRVPAVVEMQFTREN